jgi:hypothetical protein
MSQHDSQSTSPSILTERLMDAAIKMGMWQAAQGALTLASACEKRGDGQTTEPTSTDAIGKQMPDRVRREMEEARAVLSRVIVPPAPENQSTV